jgi:hypothetical protein
MNAPRPAAGGVPNQHVVCGTGRGGAQRRPARHTPYHAIGAFLLRMILLPDSVK